MNDNNHSHHSHHEKKTTGNERKKVEKQSKKTKSQIQTSALHCDNHVEDKLYFFFFEEMCSESTESNTNFCKMMSLIVPPSLGDNCRNVVNITTFSSVKLRVQVREPVLTVPRSHLTGTIPESRFRFSASTAPSVSCSVSRSWFSPARTTDWNIKQVDRLEEPGPGPDSSPRVTGKNVWLPV